MNQSGLQNSINRYSKKRKSYDFMKSSNCTKNGKKSLPEVFIDLNHHPKKSKLAIEERMNRPRDDFNGEISNFNDGRTLDKSKKIVKKDNILLKNLYNTEIIKKQDENKNILNEYRDEIELLKMDNQRLREQNQKFRLNQEYFQRRLKQEKGEKLKEIDELKIIQLNLEEKLVNYEEKIKVLYEQLIKLKKNKSTHQKYQDKAQFEEQIVLTTLNSQNNRARIKGQLRSYRDQDAKCNNYDIQVEKYKRLTSPSSHSRGKTDKHINRWFEQQRDYLKIQEEKGEIAYFRTEKNRESGRNSVIQ